MNLNKLIPQSHRYDALVNVSLVSSHRDGHEILFWLIDMRLHILLGLHRSLLHPFVIPRFSLYALLLSFWLLISSLFSLQLSS